MMRSSALLRSTSPATAMPTDKPSVTDRRRLLVGQCSRGGQIDSATAEMGEVVSELVQVALSLWLFVRDVEGDLLPRRIVQEHAGCAHQADGLLEQRKPLVHVWRSPCRVR